MFEYSKYSNKELIYKACLLREQNKSIKDIQGELALRPDVNFQVICKYLHEYKESKKTKS